VRFVYSLIRIFYETINILKTTYKSGEGGSLNSKKLKSKSENCRFGFIDSVNEK